MVVALALMIILVIHHPNMPGYPDPQKVSPLESLKFWELMLNGPDTSWLPSQREYQTQLAAWWPWFDVNVALAVAGLLTMAAALIVPRVWSKKRGSVSNGGGN